VHIAGVEEMNPVAWLVEGYDGIGSHIRTVVTSKPKPDSWVTVTPLYTEQEWQYLSDDEIKEIIGSYSNGIGGYTRELFDKIEAKIKEKNDIFSS
jgi:chlorite dismutase